MMPRRQTTRAHGRATRIDAERARNQKTRENLENTWGEAYFSTRTPPGQDDDDPPF
jgi:hypothetical protein